MDPDSVELFYENLGFELAVLSSPTLRVVTSLVGVITVVELVFSANTPPLESNVIKTIAEAPTSFQFHPRFLNSIVYPPCKNAFSQPQINIFKHYSQTIMFALTSLLTKRLPQSRKQILYTGKSYS